MSLKLCRRCLAVRTQRPLCHGCAGRFGGWLTADLLRRWGLNGAGRRV